MEYEEAKRHFKIPVCRARARRVQSDTGATLLLEQNFYRRRALISAANTTGAIMVRSTLDANEIFMLGAVVPTGEVTTQEAVYCQDSASGLFYVWEEYWCEGSKAP